MFDSARLLARLKLHEGLRLKPYTDTNGHLTIGYGLNLDGGITQEEAQFLLESRMKVAVAGARALINNFDALSPVRQEVVVELTYNMGVPVFGAFKRTIAFIEAGEWEKAAEAMLDSLWAKQVKGRAKDLADLMRSG